MNTQINLRFRRLLHRAGLIAGGMLIQVTLHAQTSLNTAQHQDLKIKIAPAESLGSRDLTVLLPSAVNGQTLSVVLNGHDVTTQFEKEQCGATRCAHGTVSTTDGLKDGKNVLYATAKTRKAGVMTARIRFDGTESSKSMPILRRELKSLLTEDGDPIQLPTRSAFLPPTVAIKTLGSGGVSSGQAWIQLGSQIQIKTDCTDRYTAIVLDRSSLQQKFVDDDSDPLSQCFDNGKALSGFLQARTPDDLVIVGTNLYNNTDADAGAQQFDTSAIGGSVFNCDPSTNTTCKTLAGASKDIPLGYVAIGAGGAEPGTAFENYYTANDSVGTVPNFNGVLTEDPWNNYDFNPTGAVEYWTTPATQAQGGTSTISFSSLVVPSVSSAGAPAIIQPPNTNGVGGYWLLKMDRSSMQLEGTYQPTFDGVTYRITAGTFYATGSTDDPTAGQQFANLAADLNQTKRNDLVFLVSVGAPLGVKGGASEASQLAYYNGKAWLPAYYGMFAPALEAFGVPAPGTMYLFNSTDAFSLVSCTACGDSLTGNAALSTTRNASQGENGMLHGLLEPDQHGMYWPVRTAQASAADRDSADFSLDQIVTQTPVEWPELSGSLLTNASSVSGQEAAYHYLSYTLITQYYIVGAQGNYLDDIHFYFTGSDNTSLNYHYGNPLTVSFPGDSGSCYAWADPVTGTTLPCFTQQDQQAVAKQLLTEVVDLTNVLQFMVNGSTNMKQNLIEGSGSAAMSLIGAASTIQAGSLAPPPSTPAKVNTGAILSFIGNAINLGVSAATAGVVPVDLSSKVKDGVSLATTLLGDSGTYIGGFNFKTPGKTYLPSPQYKMATTLGEIGNSNLQSDFAIGFDTQLDSILGDWTKLSQLGPKITNSNDPDYYSPNQAAQDVVTQLVGQASQRYFYLQLLPSYYSVQYYPTWGTNISDMGTLHGSSNACHSWYSWQALPANVEVVYPTYASQPEPWLQMTYNGGPKNPYDQYILAGATGHPGDSSEQTIAFADPTLTAMLFTQSGLNMPMDEVMWKGGPMASNFLDASVSDFDHFHNDAVYACSN